MLDINPIQDDEKKDDVNKTPTQQDRGIDIDNIKNKAAVENNSTDSGQYKDQKTQETKKDPLKWDQFIKDEQDEFVHETNENNKLLLVFTIIAAVIVVGVWGYLYFTNGAKAQQLETLNTEQQQLNKDLKDPEIAPINKLAQRFSTGIDELSGSLKNPKLYSQMFSNLQKIVPDEVVLQSYQFDEKDKVKLSASFVDMSEGARLVKNMQESDYFAKVSLVGIQMGNTSDDYAYTMSLTAEAKKELLELPEEKKDIQLDEIQEEDVYETN